MNKKVIISACLLGDYCRYDGKTKVVSSIIEAFKEYEIIPFCPEAPLFGTPRERISVVEFGDELKIITDETNKDVTLLLENKINSFMQMHPDVDRIVLKSKSPSCGYKTTPILNREKMVVKIGSGIAANLFSRRFQNIKIEDETSF